MKKINWFKRLFMSWRDIEMYFNNGKESSETIAEVKELYSKRIFELEEDRTRLSNEKAILEQAKVRVEEMLRSKDENLSTSKDEILTLNNKIDGFKDLLAQKEKENSAIKNDIRDQLLTINKIESTFFAKTGNKGKGELGEQQVKTILEKMGLPADMWTTNLTVGKNTVEFAMQSGDEGKFIPIDSKVLETKVDENGLAIIDDGYKNKVKAAAKEINKYLGKSNTADYGILVLQSDSIYMALFDEYPSFFQDMIEDFKVYIQSPSSFVQTAWSISNIVKIYNRVHNDEKIYEDIVSVLETVANFGNNLSKTHKTFNVAMKNFNTIESKHSKLVKRLDKEGKVKTFNKIENKEEAE